jgi:hypothetical protein
MDLELLSVDLSKKVEHFLLPPVADSYRVTFMIKSLLHEAASQKIIEKNRNKLNLFEI